MNLKARIERLEAARSVPRNDYTIIRRFVPDGGGIVTEIRDGRVTRRELTPEEAARLERGAATIQRSYAGGADAA